MSVSPVALTETLDPRGERPPWRPPGYRVLATRASFQVGVAGIPTPLVVTRVALHAIRARLLNEAPASLPTGSTTATLSMGYRDLGPLPCTLSWATPGEELELRFGTLAQADAASLYELVTTQLARGALGLEPTRVASRWHLEGKSAIRRLRALAGSDARGYLLPAHGMPWPVRLRAVEADGLQLAVQGPLPEPLFHVELDGPYARYRFAAADGERVRQPRGSQRGLIVQVPLPDLLLAERRRWRRRARAPDGLVMSYRHPMWPAQERVRRLRDVSTTGLAVWLWPEEDLLSPGLELSDVSVHFHGEIVCEGRALVHHVTERPASMQDGGGEAVCGLSFEPQTPGDDARWINLVHHLLNPRTRSGAAWSLQSWRVYTDSGYFHLSGKTPRQFEGLQGSYREVSRGLDAAPWLGCQAVWPSDRGVEATFTFVKTYAQTWFGYQLAKSPDRPDPSLAPPRKVLRELYARVFEHMQHDKQLRWVAGYLEGSVPWNQVAQFGWVAGRSGDDTCLVDFHLMEGQCAAMQAEPPEGVLLADADDEGVAVLLAHLERTRPRSWQACLDLTAASFDLAQIRAKWRRVGLHRDRRCVVASRHGQPVAAAVLETGETGASLFSLLDSVRVFAFTHGGEAAFPALLAAGARWYESLGKTRFVLYREVWPAADASAAGLVDLGHGKLWAIERHLLPDFLEHVAALLAPKRPPDE